MPWKRELSVVLISRSVHHTHPRDPAPRFWRCELCGSGNYSALPVHAPAPAGTTVDRSLAAHRAEHRTDLFVRLVDTARRMAAFGRHTIIISCTILERGRGRCDRRSRGQRSRSWRQGTRRSRRSTPACQKKTCSEEQHHGKPGMIHDHVSGISNKKKIIFWEE